MTRPLVMHSILSTAMTGYDTTGCGLGAGDWGSGVSRGASHTRIVTGGFALTVCATVTAQAHMLTDGDRDWLLLRPVGPVSVTC